MRVTYFELVNIKLSMKIDTRGKQLWFPLDVELTKNSDCPHSGKTGPTCTCITATEADWFGALSSLALIWDLTFDRTFIQLTAWFSFEGKMLPGQRNLQIFKPKASCSKSILDPHHIGPLALFSFLSHKTDHGNKGSDFPDGIFPSRKQHHGFTFSVRIQDLTKCCYPRKTGRSEQQNHPLTSQCSSHHSCFCNFFLKYFSWRSCILYLVTFVFFCCQLHLLLPHHKYFWGKVCTALQSVNGWLHWSLTKLLTFPTLSVLQNCFSESSNLLKRNYIPGRAVQTPPSGFFGSYAGNKTLASWSKCLAETSFQSEEWGKKMHQ